MGETAWAVILGLVVAYLLFRLERVAGQIDDIHRLVGVLVEQLPDDDDDDENA